MGEFTADATFAAAHHNVNVGDFILTPDAANVDYGPNFGVNLPALAPGAKICMQGGLYGWRRIYFAGTGGTVGTPLVITNFDGQVGLTYMELLGFENVIIVGQYDLAAQTGDPNHLGYDAGVTGNATSFGFTINKNYAPSGISGLVIGEDFRENPDVPCKKIVASYMDLGRGGFADIQVKNDNFVNPTGAIDCTIHNCNLRDSDSGEGAYIGSTGGANAQSNIKLTFYNNLSVRNAAEGGQFGKLAEDSKVFNNVFVMPAQDHLAPFQNFQDKSVQLGAMNGTVEFTRNIVLGGESMFFVNEYDWIDAGGAVHNNGLVDFHDNYYGDFRNILAFFGGSGDPGAPSTSFRFGNNYVGPAEFLDNRKDTGNRVALIQGSNQNDDLLIENNFMDSSITDLFVWTGFENQANVTHNNTTVAVVERPLFENSGYPDSFQWGRSEQWKAVKDLPGMSEDGQVPDYPVGWRVHHNGNFYEVISATSGAVEPGVTAGWQTFYNDLGGPPADDFRLRQGTFYYNLGYGLMQRVVKKTGPFTSGENLTYSVTVDGGAPPAWFIMTVEGNTDSNAATDIITFDFKAATQAENGTYAIVLTGTGPAGSGQQAFSVTVDTLL